MMTEDQLAAIEARHHSAQWTLTPSSQISTCDAIADIPALVAEVRRLQRENAVYEAAVALAETCELGCGDYGGNIFDDELLFKYREARLKAEDGE